MFYIGSDLALAAGLIFLNAIALGVIGSLTLAIVVLAARLLTGGGERHSAPANLTLVFDRDAIEREAGFGLDR